MSLAGHVACTVGVGTRYGLDSPGIESRWRRDFFCTRPDWHWIYPAFCKIGVTGQRHAPAALYPREDPVLIVQKAGRVPGPV